jgi:hypothetical protein
MIYLISIDGIEFVKIGYTKDDQSMKVRLMSLQIGNPMALSVAHIEPGEQNLERRYHRLLRDVRKSGEWFYLGNKLSKFIENAKSFGLDSAIKRLVRHSKSYRSIIDQDKARETNWQYRQIIMGENLQ